MTMNADGKMFVAGVVVLSLNNDLFLIHSVMNQLCFGNNPNCFNLGEDIKKQRNNESNSSNVSDHLNWDSLFVTWFNAASDPMKDMIQIYSQWN